MFEAMERERERGREREMPYHLMVFSLPWLLFSLGNLSIGKGHPMDAAFLVLMNHNVSKCPLQASSLLDILHT
jgi:hypothetical protein